jgi:NAD(P)-dependent dehydrogenase (short-subunit alcohol dehydrogenase family)
MKPHCRQRAKALQDQLVLATMRAKGHHAFMDFTNKTVLVTGASRGIGRVAAEQFAAAGARVALHYRGHQAEAEQTFAALAGSGHVLLQAELAAEGAAEKLIADAVAAFGHLDVLVNNAGIYYDHPLFESSFDEWRKNWQTVFDINLFAVADLCYWAAQHMKQQGGGKIVNVSSRGAFRGEPTAPAYGASKAALNQLSQSLAQYLAPHNICVHVVAPGFVDTERVAYKVAGEVGEAIRKQSPFNRVATADEVARTILFLSSDGIDFLSGCIVDVNGASYLRS